jgi:ELWxxDGT repeat protein
MAAFKEEIYFLIRKNLWKTDGTDAGTVIVKSMAENFAPFSRELVAGENKMFFCGNDGIHGGELWVSDGTTAGTHMVEDIHDGIDSRGDVSPGIIVNDVVYFFADAQGNRKLWRSDGTVEGTYLLKDINADPGYFNQFWSMGNSIFFVAYDNTHGPELWTSDGTEQGTVLVKDINPNGSSLIDAAFELNGNLYFSANDGNGVTLWKSDGTKEGTRFIADIKPLGLYTSLNNKLFFSAFEEQSGDEVWMYNPDPQDQTITFNPIPDKLTTDSPFELEANASSGLAVTFEIISGPATLSGNLVTITGAGTVSVKALQPGNIDFNPASAEQSFDVTIPVGLEDAPFGITVWPNPAINNLVIVSADQHNFVLKDMLGRDVLSTNINQQETIDVGHLPRGIYVMTFKSNSATVSRKVLLK